MPGGVQPGDHVEAEHVRKVQVEQHQVWAQLLHRGDCLFPGARGCHDPEVFEPFDETAMDPGHPEVIINDQHVDHGPASSGATDIRAVNIAPSSVFVTATSPPRR